MPVSDSAIAHAAYNAGFRGPDLTRAVAVALAESSGNPDARNSIGASGLWQILQSAHPEFAAQWSSGSWRDPNENAKMAYSVWKAAGGWGPWVSSSAGQAMYQGRAAAATKDFDPNAPVTGDAAAVGASGSIDTSGLSGFVDIVKTILDPHTWFRGAMFMLGIILTLKGMDMLSGLNAIPKIESKVRTTAAQVAVLK